MPGVIVIGIGQIFRGDDAAGPAVVEAWRRQRLEALQDPLVSVAITPLPGLALLDQISGFEKAILVDAVLGGPGVSPGSLLLLDPEDLAEFSSEANSSHGWGVAETLKLAETLGRQDMPEEIIIIGIGAAQVELGAGLSPQVADAIPAAVEMLGRLVWGG